MRAALLFLIAPAVFVGCTTVPPAEPPEQEAFGFVSGSLHMERCTGIGLRQFYPPGANPAPVPTGWGVVEDDVTQISLWLWECPRVGIDHLERAATVLWEVSDHARPSRGCAFADGFPAQLLLSARTDDEVLADHLATTYGVPVRLATFERAPTREGHDWSWSTQGEESSLRTVWSEDPNRRQMRSPIDRWVWPADGGMGWMDINWTRVQNVYLQSFTHGELGPSHHIGFGGRFAGVSSIVENGVMEDAEWFGRIRTGGPSCD